MDEDLWWKHLSQEEALMMARALDKKINKELLQRMWPVCIDWVYRRIFPRIQARRETIFYATSPRVCDHRIQFFQLLLGRNCNPWADDRINFVFQNFKDCVFYLRSTLYQGVNVYETIFS